ncbi:MAG: 30S ribosomal protein S20, partial [Verrucomicrobiota bacterium]
MANHKSSIKRARQTLVRTERNRAEKSRMKTLRKKTLTAIAAGDKDVAAKVSAEFSS